MLNPAQLADLSKFNAAPLLVSSLYLNTDPKRFSKPALLALLKDLSRERLAELKDAGLTHDQLKSVEADLERLHDSLSGHAFTRPGERGLAAFSCANRDFFQKWTLPHGFKATLLIGPTPYLRPLQALLAQSPHAVTVLLDQHRARAYSVHGDEIADMFDVTHDTGSRIKKGGFQGKDTSRVEHRHDEAVHHHYQDAADRLLHAFQSAPFEYLILAGHLDEISGFERHLHSYVAERVAGRFRADVRTIQREEIRAKTVELVSAEETIRRDDLVRRLAGAARTNGGLAVTGLKNTLSALNDRRVQTLLVTEDFAHAGRHCEACSILVEKEAACPRCSAPTVEAGDVVDEAVAQTVHQGGSIRILPEGCALAEHGKIGAMLRY
jgi:peptide chain release factor subunit 1